MPLKVVKGRRPGASFIEFYHAHNPVLCNLFNTFRESVIYGRKINLSIKEDHAPIVLWKGVYARYQKLKELEVKMKLLQHYEERVS